MTLRVAPRSADFTFQIHISHFSSQALVKMKSDWEAINFNFVPYKDTDISILAAIDDVQVLLDDHIVKTTTMKNSPFIKPFETEINEWDQRLVRLDGFLLKSITKFLSLLVFISSCILSMFLTASYEGHLGFVVESASCLALSGTYLWLSGHPQPDTSRGPNVRGGGWALVGT